MKQSYKYTSILVLFFIISFTLSSCATLFKGSTQNVNFSSDPVDAKVYVNGTLLGRTPVQLNLKTNSHYTIEFKKDGFETRTVTLNNSVGGGWVVLDVLGGLVPIIVDAATGNWYSLDQEHVNAVLEKQVEAKK